MMTLAGLFRRKRGPRVYKDVGAGLRAGERLAGSHRGLHGTSRTRSDLAAGKVQPMRK